MSKYLGGVSGAVSGLIRGPKATNRAARHITSGLGAAQNKLSPYMESGEQANTMLKNKIASGELGGTFKPGDLTKEPGYEFQLQQGEQALGRKAAAPGGGGYFSGQALKEAQQYGQELASKTYGDAHNRWLQGQALNAGLLGGQQRLGFKAAQDYGGYSTKAGETMADATLAKEQQRMKGLSSIISMFG